MEPRGRLQLRLHIEARKFMSQKSESIGAGPYEGTGEPEGKKTDLKKSEKRVLGENLPGYGSPPPHGERGIDERKKP